ncbi:MAG: hypothetical protein ABI144_03500 [Gallionella sp.]
MIRLDQSLRAWGEANFKATLKHEIEALGADRLPLQQGLSSSSYVAESPITVMIQHVAETENAICIKAGIFYQGIIGGCSCADDPTPVGENNEYCEVQIEINKANAATAVALISE